MACNKAEVNAVESFRPRLAASGFASLADFKLYRQKQAKSIPGTDRKVLPSATAVTIVRALAIPKMDKAASTLPTSRLVAKKAELASLIIRPTSIGSIESNADTRRGSGSCASSSLRTKDTTRGILGNAEDWESNCNNVGWLMTIQK